MKYKAVNVYHVVFLYPSRFTWNKNGMEESWINVKAYNVQRAIITAKVAYPCLIVKKVSFIHKKEVI